ncbi:MAG: energy transducer TonB [Gammaproteobacteria bacterium]|nr:energy transducer TonB [Gammaproteobacteria bacterium]
MEWGKIDLMSSEQQMGIALFTALLFHMVLILGVEFEFSNQQPPDSSPLTMEVILVSPPDTEPPRNEEADYLAQKSQSGGGKSGEKRRPTVPPPTSASRPEQGHDGQSQPRQTPKKRPQPRHQELQQQETSALKIESVEELPDEASQPVVTAAELLRSSSHYIQQLALEIRDHQESYSKKPRERYITASTREYAFASYEESWRQKVERIGNLNYPDEAERDGIHGALLLDVAIRADGSVDSIRIIRSSGSRILDEGARQIVYMASPFAPLTAAIRKTTDILHITRTWQFHDDNHLTAR